MCIIFVLYENTNKRMRKTTQKRQKYNEDILLVLHNKFGYSIDFIRKCLRGDRVGLMPDAIKKEYKLLENEAEKLQQDVQNKLQEKANQIN